MIAVLIVVVGCCLFLAAGPYSFNGSVDGDFNTAANWTPNGVPATAEAFSLNHLAQRALDSNLNQSAKSFAGVVVTEDYPFQFGSSANKFQANISSLAFAGGGSPGCYIKGAVTRAAVMAVTTADDVLTIEGSIQVLALRAGKIAVAGSSTQPAGSLWWVGALSGDEAHYDSSKLTIASTVDLATNSTQLQIMGGSISCAANVAGTIAQAGGRFKLTDSATAALLLAQAGLFEWESDGTITMAHVAGSARFDGGAKDPVKTLTNMSVYDDAVADFSRAFNTTFTNPIRRYGNATLIGPMGRTIAFAA